MRRIPFLWTDDDICAQTPSQLGNLERMLDFLDRWNIPGSFFVIPHISRGLALTDEPRLCERMRTAQQQGHGFYQHGCSHDPYENGPPDLRMLEFDPQVKARFDQERFAIDHMCTLENIRKNLTHGKEVFTQVFGQPSLGFRGGWGSYSRNLFIVLPELGFAWDSTMMNCWTSWTWAAHGVGSVPLEFDAQVPIAPYRIGELWEYSIVGDFSFQVKPGEEDAYLGLAIKSFEHCYENGLPCNMVSHWHGLERNGDTGYRVQERFLEIVLSSGKAEPMTLGQFHACVQAGQVPTAEKRIDPVTGQSSL